MRIVFSDDGRDFLRRDWTHLAEEDPSGTFFHRPAYLKLYWEEFGETPEHLLLGFAEQDDGTLSAAVAFERVGDVLRFLGGTEVTDYMGPVGLPSMREPTARALLDALRDRDDWSSADLRGLREDDPWLAALRGEAPDAGLEVEETEDQNGVAPFLTLPATWDAYLAGPAVEAAARDQAQGDEARDRNRALPDRRGRRGDRSGRCSTGSWSCIG